MWVALGAEEQRAHIAESDAEQSGTRGLDVEFQVVRILREIVDPPQTPASYASGDVAGARQASTLGEMASSDPQRDAERGLGPLTPNDLLQLERGFERRRALARGVTLARANGIALLVTAALCLPFALFQFSLWLVVGALGASAWAELRGARMLRELDARAPKWLALNQLALLAAVACYCIVSIYSGLHAQSPLTELANASPELGEQLRELGHEADGSFGDGVYRAAVIGFYLALLAACAVYQGVCAYFYLRRIEALRAHREQTPAWVREVQRRLFGW